MILLSQAKKKALFLSFILFGGSISGLGALKNVGKDGDDLGKVGAEDVAGVAERSVAKSISGKSESLGSNSFKEIFSESKKLKIFDKSQYLSSEKLKKVSDQSDIAQRIKEEIFKKIVEKVKTKKIKGQFIYKWITDNALLAIVRFRLEQDREWYYDGFSVTIS